MLLPLSNAQRIAKFGRFQFRADPADFNPERVRILGGWAEKNIADVRPPAWFAQKFERHHVNINYLAVGPFLNLLDAWHAAGLDDCIHTWNGSWVARFKRQNGTIAERKAKCLTLGAASLSNHAWGTAFDINAQLYPLGKLVPAGADVRQLVPIANAHGWFWGGDFKSRPDGMHFEFVGVP